MAEIPDPNSEAYQQYLRKQQARAEREAQDTNLGEMAVLMRAGIGRMLLNFMDRQHASHEWPRINPENVSLGLVKAEGCTEIRGWWSPVDPFRHQRIDWRWTLRGGPEKGYYISYVDEANHLSPDQSLVIDELVALKD